VPWWQRIKKGIRDTKIMEKQNKENSKDVHAGPPKDFVGEGLDASGRSLSEAFKFSFIILKIIMIAVVVAFLASGFKTVDSDERALVLQLGKIRGIGEERVLGPGLHWVLPYPIEEIIRIPVEKKVTLPLNSFWYFQTKEEMLEGAKKRSRPPPVSLNPLVDGYCITRSEKQSDVIAGSDGSDYNIVHCKWQITYQIDDPERFFRNIYVEDVKPGEIYFDIITKSITPLLEDLIEGSVVTAMVDYTIDEAIKSQDRIPKHVRRLLQERLDKIESGIKIVDVYLTDITWPRQVDEAFLASIKAGQTSQKAISEARTYAENTLNEAAGPVAERLFAALHNKNISEQEEELLWSQLAGAGEEKIAQARAYRTMVVETAKANADYLQRLLPEYRKRPQLVIQKVYQDAIEYVLDNADEKFIIQPTEGAGGKELRILVNRDPTLKPKSAKGQKTQ
jgi:membrane protease subunit HflK